jgi:hypothetical protein
MCAYVTRKPTKTQLQLWRQVGFDMDGEDANDYSGYAVSLSADGKVLAIGAPSNNNYSGHVRVYAWDSTSAKYTQRGSDIDGEAAGDVSGLAVSLSADGKVLAIGAPYNNGYTGHVRVYAWNSTIAKYTQRGSDIDGEAAYDGWSGIAVSLSADGKVLAIGAPWNDGKNGTDSGHVRVYAWDSTIAKYTQRGSDIDGEATYDESGFAVSLSADGKVLAIGAPSNDGKNGTDSGHVRVYAWNSTIAKYIQRGSDIDGEAAYDLSGLAVSLSADGKVLAIGAPSNSGKNGTGSGHVRVYAWNSTIAKYTQRGSDIDGEAAGDVSGLAVSLSADGKVLAIGAPENDGKNGTGSGHVRVYAWDSTSAKYTQRGTDIDGEAAVDVSGVAVSLSADGKVLAIGAPWNNNYSGHVRLYAWGIDYKCLVVGFIHCDL